MRKGALKVLVVACLCVSVRDACAQAAASACHGLFPQQDIAVQVVQSGSEVPVFRQFGYQELAGMGRGHIHVGPNRRVLGLTQSRIGGTFSLSTSVGVVPSLGGACASPLEIRMTVGDSDTSVAIAREIPPGSCRDVLVLEHEYTHVANARGAVAQRLPALDQTLRSLAWHPYFPVWAPTPEQASEAVKSSVRAIMDAEIAEMDRLRRILDGALDSPESYAAQDARMLALCGAR